MMMLTVLSTTLFSVGTIGHVGYRTLEVVTSLYMDCSIVARHVN
jgi:hypothetical protein